MVYSSLAERLEKFITHDANDCWQWHGAINRYGYGHLCIKGKTVMAHRAAYELHKGIIPTGFELDHLCHNPSCINPAHLEPVTHQENMRRSKRAAERSAHPLCKNGHVMDGIRTRAGGGRYCKTCVMISKRRQRAKGAL